jgi:hypothetical protein
MGSLHLNHQECPASLCRIVVGAPAMHGQLQASSCFGGLLLCFLQGTHAATACREAVPALASRPPIY